MGKLLRRGWRYLVAALSGKLDEVSDPRIQIEQAIDEAKTQHQLLSQQAAAVIGNERELELKLTRSIEETEKLQANARQALLLAEQARQAGDDAKASTYEDSARAFATRLVSAESAMRDLHTMHERASQASAQARAAVESNAPYMSAPGGIGYGPERHSANGFAPASPATPTRRSASA